MNVARPKQLLTLSDRFLDHVDPALAGPLAARVRYHQRRLAAAERRFEWLDRAASRVSTLGMIAAYLSPGAIAVALSGFPAPSPGGVKIAALATVVGWVVFFRPLSRYIVRPRWARGGAMGRWVGQVTDEFLVRTSLLVSISLLLSILAYSLRGAGPYVRFGVSAGLLLPSIMMMTALLTAAVLRPVYRFRQRRMNRMFADSALAVSYLRMLDELAPVRSPRQEMARRRVANIYLDDAAELLEHGLPQLVRATGAPVDEDVRAGFRRMANAQRERKQLLHFAPEGETGSLEEAVVNALVAAAFRRWSMLPQAERTPVRQRVRIWSYARNLAVSLFIAALPLGALALVRELGVGPGELPPSVVAIAWGWAVVTLLSALDPAMGGKVAIVKDALGLVRPGAK
jgi:hypothetical protein